MSERWGIVPAAGLGTRIQPLAFSKELLPVGIRHENEIEHPRAVCEYLLDRMLYAGVTRICFVISSPKNDIISYFGGRAGPAPICYAVQEKPAGLCDAIFTALPFIRPEDEVLVGLPDTIWFPENGFGFLPNHKFSFLLFPVKHPELFDSVITSENGSVLGIQVKEPRPGSHWIWGGFKLSGQELSRLRQLWWERNPRDQYFGTLVNAYLAHGGHAIGIKAGEKYVDVGTLHGYHEAVRMLGGETDAHEFQEYSIANR
jgi:glucose-1-phosphate thymidylyltransferase